MKLQNIARIIQKTKCLIRSGNKYNMYLSSKKDSNYRKITSQKGESTIKERNSKRDIRKRILHGDNNNMNNLHAIQFGGKSFMKNLVFTMTS